MDESKLGLHPDTAKIRALAAERNITTAAAAQLLAAQAPPASDPGTGVPMAPIEVPAGESDTLTVDDVELIVTPAPAD